MGGGDLNMKKSWHPLLLKNQERVWLEEKKALEEKKKLDQLRKEKEEERQLQELQRLQEEQTGRKRTEKLEWMYTTPATGSNQNPNDLEDYLLGKKRVDKILTADENAKLGAAHKNFIAVQNANTARDIASKIREDPLLAIKQQEQAAYQALMSNPLRLREMQERNGIKPKKDKKDKKREKHSKKKDKHRMTRSASRSLSPPEGYRSHRRSSSNDRVRSRRSLSPYDRRSRSPRSPRSRYDNRRHSSGEYQSKTRALSRSSHSPNPYRRRRDENTSLERSRRVGNSHVRVWPRSDDSDEGRRSGNSSRSKSVDRADSKREVDRKRRRSPSPPRHPNVYSKRTRHSPQPPPLRSSQSSRAIDQAAEDRAARLAAMTSNASSMNIERQERLKSLLAKEKADLEAEDRARAKSKGVSGFLSQEQKKVFGGSGGLEDRIRRGRGGMLVDAE